MSRPAGPVRLQVAVAVDGPDRDRLVSGLAGEGFIVVGGPVADALDLVLDADALVLAATRSTVTPELVAACDRAGTRIIALSDDPDVVRTAEASGLPAPLPTDAPAWRIADAVTSPATTAAPTEGVTGVVIAVWGPPGAPGRSTVAAALAAELARTHRVALIDADAHAPSLALALGLADEGPGFAAACRQAERGGLDAAELTRISTPLTLAGGAVDVLTGINRPARWPELSDTRVEAALAACRTWADVTVVDVAAPLERDEEIVSDLDGPRRNAATLAALRTADLVVSVLSADPLGAARFVRGVAELRAVVGATPVAVLANRLRPGALGLDPRGQVRRTLDRFAGITDVTFLPLDPRSMDAAMLAARPVAEVAPRSPFALGIRRFVAETVRPVLPVDTGGALPDPAERRRAAPRRQRAPRTSGVRGRTA